MFERGSFRITSGKRLVALDGPDCYDAVKTCKFESPVPTPEEERAVKSGFSEVTGELLLDEDGLIGSTQVETSLLITALTLLVILIHEQHNGSRVGKQLRAKWEIQRNP